MAGNIADHLCRLFRPRRLTIIHRVIIYLRMPDGSYNTKLYALLSSRQSGKESTLMIVIERTAQSITHFVRESSNTRHLISIGFHCQRIFRHLWSRCRPSFTIYKYSRIYRRCRLTDFVHCFDVMDTHQVKTEAVNVIFINPVQYRLNHVFTHHRTVAGSFIATSRTVCIRAIRPLTIKVSWNCTFEIAVRCIESMVIHHIQNNTDTSFVQSLHHLLEFADTNIRLIRVSGIRAVRYIVVLRIISPIILVLVQLCLINGGIVIRRKEMYMCHSQFFQMVNAGCQLVGTYRSLFCQCQELSFMLNTRRRVDGHITMVHFIKNHIGRRGQCRTFIICPSFGVRGFHVDDGGTLSIHPYSFGIDTRSVPQPLIIDFHIECVEFTDQVLFNFSFPSPFFR